MDGTIKLWDFLTLKVMNTIEVGEGATLSHLDVNSVNNMSVIANKSDKSGISLLVYDIKTLKNIRKFDEIATNTITSTCFSHDSKWVITASMDKSIKVWDLLTARLVDWVSFTNIPMAVAFSPVGEYLVTSHVDQKGLYLWSNRAFFGNVFLQDEPKHPHYLDLPDITDTEKKRVTHQDFYMAKNAAKQRDGEEKKLHADLVDKEFDDLLKSDLGLLATKDTKDLAKISDDPFSKWQSLYYIDNIKERNRPLDAKTKKQDAPFFLFDLDSVLKEHGAGVDLYGVQYFTGTKAADDKKELSTIIKESKQISAGKDQEGREKGLKALLNRYTTKEVTIDSIFDYLRAISPSAIELEILNLTDYEFDTEANVDYVRYLVLLMIYIGVNIPRPA
jgi:WD40 repeat protein